MKKLSFMWAVLFAASTMMHAAPRRDVAALSNQELAEELAYAQAAYKRQDDISSLGDRVKVHLPFASALLKKSGTSRDLHTMRAKRNMLQNEWWKRNGKKGAGRWMRQHWHEAVILAALLAALGGTAYGVGSWAGARVRDKRDKAAEQKQIDRDNRMIAEADRLRSGRPSDQALFDELLERSDGARAAAQLQREKDRQATERQEQIASSRRILNDSLQRGTQIGGRETTDFDDDDDEDSGTELSESDSDSDDEDDEASLSLKNFAVFSP